MKTIGVFAMKGGVGKTTLTANLAAALAEIHPGRPVYAIDLDPQNTLHLHFSPTRPFIDGLCRLGLRGVPLSEMPVQDAFGVRCIPFGSSTEEEQDAFSTFLEAAPNWLVTQLQGLNLPKQSILVVDTPPGPNAFNRQLLKFADHVLSPTPPDAATYLTLSEIDRQIQEAQKANHKLQHSIVLNKTDSGDPLSRDITEILLNRFQDRCAPLLVHLDMAVPESLTVGQPVIKFDPHAQVSRDFRQMAHWLTAS